MNPTPNRSNEELRKAVTLGDVEAKIVDTLRRDGEPSKECIAAAQLIINLSAENEKLRGALAFINGHQYGSPVPTGKSDEWFAGYGDCVNDVDAYIEANFTVEYLFPTQPTTDKEATTE